MGEQKEEPRYNIVSVRLSDHEIEIINRIVDARNISSSKAARVLMFGDEQRCCPHHCDIHRSHDT